MDVQKFRDSRERELSEFQQKNNFLKTEYKSALSSAIREADPASQQDLIQHVLQLNASMADEIRSMISKMNQGTGKFNSADLNQLTTELIQYQKEYDEIEHSKDKVNTLKRIHEDTKNKTTMASTMYSIYIAVFIILLCVVAYLVFKTEWARRVISIAPKVLSR